MTLPTTSPQPGDDDDDDDGNEDGDNDGNEDGDDDGDDDDDDSDDENTFIEMCPQNLHSTPQSVATQKCLFATSTVIPFKNYTVNGKKLQT